MLAYGWQYLLADFHAEMQLLQVANRSNLDVDSRLVIALVKGLENKLLEFGLQVLQLKVLGLWTYSEVILLFHRFASGYIVHPLGIVDNVRNLHRPASVDLSKDGKKKGDVLDHKLDFVNIDTISNIIRVLNE
jgi:hypothetical protein